MKSTHSAWLGFWWQSARLMQEAQQVVALRLMRLAQGGALAQSETRRMVSEKVAAAIEAQASVATAVALGQHGPRVAKKALNPYRKRVRRNRRRLTRSK